MSDNQLYAIIWLGIMAIVISISVCVTVYALNTPSDYEIMERMVSKYNVNPMVFECMDRNWSQAPDYNICKKVIENHKLTNEEAQHLKDMLK